MTNKIILAFIPIFVAVDAIGVLPLFINLTSGLNSKDKNRIILYSIVTAILMACFFIFMGKAVFKFLGITVADFMIAGGAILFCISIIDLVFPGKKRRIPKKDLGVVPLGTPLIVGPAVLTTSLIIIDEYGLYATLISVIINVFIAGIIFSLSHYILRIIGETGTRAFSKITSLLLAAIAIMMIRKGIFLIINTF